MTTISGDQKIEREVFLKLKSTYFQSTPANRNVQRPTALESIKMLSKVDVFIFGQRCPQQQSAVSAPNLMYLALFPPLPQMGVSRCIRSVSEPRSF
jgi:hypothetical protein